MSKLFFTVGPSQLYPTAKKHIARALKDDICSISHRSEQFREIFSDATSALRKLMDIPDDFRIFFLSSATEAMERIIQNCAARHSFHFVNGAFSNRFLDISLELGKNPQKIKVAFGTGFDFKDVRVPEETELICLTQNETSAGTSIPMENIYGIKKSYPKKLITVDIVSSSPSVKIDYSLIDIVFFSVQKGFGLPAGLGVLIANEKSLEKSKDIEGEKISTGSYHNFSSLKKYAEKNQTSETPNVLNIYLFGKIVGDMLKYGTEKIRKDTQEKAKMIYDFFDHHPKMKPFVTDKKIRSQTIAVIETPGGSKKIVEKLKEAGIIVSTGYKEKKGTQIRIANFPSHKVADIQHLLEKMKRIKN